MPLRLHRVASGARVCPASRCTRVAIFAGDPHRGVQHRHWQVGHHRGVPLRRPAMRMTGGLAGAEVWPSWPRRFSANLTCGLAAVVRPPRVKARRIERAYLQLLVAAVVALAVIAATMVLLDAPVAEAMKRAPVWIIALF